MKDTTTINNVPVSGSNQDNTPGTANPRTPYTPGLEFYDGGFDPNLPSNSPEFARAVAAGWMKKNGKDSNA